MPVGSECSFRMRSNKRHARDEGSQTPLDQLLDWLRDTIYISDGAIDIVAHSLADRPIQWTDAAHWVVVFRWTIWLASDEKITCSWGIEVVLGVVT